MEIVPLSTLTDPASLARLQAAFLGSVLPKVQRHGRIYFRGARSDRRADLVAEVVALAWKWFMRLVCRLSSFDW